MRAHPRCSRLAVLAASVTLFQFGGCNPTLQTTIENGIIDSSTSFLASFFRALINVASEAATSTT